MDKLQENTLKIHLEEFPTYVELERELQDVLIQLDEQLVTDKGVATVGDVTSFTKRYELYKNTLTAISGLDKYLQQKVEERLAGYVLNFVDEPVYSLFYWGTDELVSQILPTVLEPEDISDELVSIKDKKVNLWGLREAYIRSKGLLTDVQVGGFIHEYCDIVCDEVLMYTVESMLTQALQNGEIDIMGMGRLGVNIDNFQQLLYSSAKQFDNMDDLSRHLILNKEAYTQLGPDSDDY